MESPRRYDVITHSWEVVMAVCKLRVLVEKRSSQVWQSAGLHFKGHYF